jgi:hypothetical protein
MPERELPPRGGAITTEGIHGGRIWAVSPWESRFFFAEIDFYANMQWANTGARARGGWMQVEAR